MKKETYYTEDLVKDAIEELEELKGENPTEAYEENYLDDIIHEVADNNIPIYTYDLLQYASNNFDLIYANDLSGENADVVKIIQCNIYEYLIEKLYNYINTEIKVKTKGEENG